MVLSIQLPTGERIVCPAMSARLTSADGSLAVEHPASGNVQYASARQAELTVGDGWRVRHFRMHLMNARLTPAEWSILAADFAECPEPLPESEEVHFPII